jgi:hypothetical protein
MTQHLGIVGCTAEGAALRCTTIDAEGAAYLGPQAGRVRGELPPLPGQYHPSSAATRGSGDDASAAKAEVSQGILGDRCPAPPP